MNVLVADVGGSLTRIARADEPIVPVRFDTETLYASGIERFVQNAHSLSTNQVIDTCIVGLPGVLSPDKTQLLKARNLPDWEHRPISRDIMSRLGAARVILENDTALVGLGEAHYGAGRGSRILMYLTVSTGVNGVRIVDGAVDRSTEGFEIGGQYLDHEGVLHTFESLVSGSAIEKKYGVRPKELGANSPVWGQLAHIVAIGLHNTILAWSPDTVVLGGSMFKEIGISVGAVERELRLIMHKFPTIPRIVHSLLGDDGGLYGGMWISSKH